MLQLHGQVPWVIPVAGALFLVLALTRNRVLRFVGTVVPVGIWMLTEVNVVRTGGHWPVDQTAGLLIAASLLTVFYSVGLGAIREQERAPEPTTT